MENEYSNILSFEDDSIRNFFVKGLIANENDIIHYVPVSKSIDWHIPNKYVKFKKVNTPFYEKSLINFFRNPMDDKTTHPIIAIIGGAGSGKSSTLMYTLKEANICDTCFMKDNCSNTYISRILVDFINFDVDHSFVLPSDIEKENSKKKSERFWKYLIEILDNNIENKFVEINELAKFFVWFLDKIGKSDFFKLYRILKPEKDILLDPEGNRNEFRKIRRRIYNKLKPSDLAYYKLYQIAFLRSEDIKYVNCNILVFDNIDTLDPIYQIKLLEFANQANLLLKCKSVLPMRPGTTKFYELGTNGIENKLHHIADFKQIINKRLDLYRENGKDAVYKSIKRLIDIIWNDDRMTKVLLGTSGHSIRFGLRNLYNTFLSDVIVTHTNNVYDENFPFDLNRFYEAYFCTDQNDLYNENFTNLLSLNKGTNYHLSTIKLRILHKVSNTNNISLPILLKYILDYGFSRQDFFGSLNDLLSTKKALLHSSSLAKYPINHKAKDFDYLFMTEIGDYYLNSLVKNWLYLRECIVQLDQNRENKRKDGLIRCYNIIKTFGDIDIEEIGTFVTNRSKESYKELFYPNQVSISYILFDKVKEDMQKSSEQLKKFHGIDLEIDYKRNNYIKKLIDSILI